MPRSGAVLCLLSAACFGAMGIFGKLAYDENVSVGTLLGLRFVAAAAVLWLLVAATGGLRELRGAGRRALGVAFALGAVGYALQAGLFFAALERIDVSLLSLLLYTYPAGVTVGALLLGRDRVDAVRLSALALASAGLVLVLVGPGAGTLDGLGAALALGAAGVYTAYILVSDGVVGSLPPLGLAALVLTGAAMTVLPAAVLLGDFDAGAPTAAGLGWIGAIALVSTVGAVVLFFAGLHRVGPSSASILSTCEPVVTVSLAFVVFGETLSGIQLVGGALVLAAVVVLNLRGTAARPGPAEPLAEGRAQRRGRRRAAPAAAS